MTLCLNHKWDMILYESKLNWFISDLSKSHVTATGLMPSKTWQYDRHILSCGNHFSILDPIDHKSKYHKIIYDSSYHQKLTREAMRIEKWVSSMIWSFSSVPNFQSGMRKSNKIDWRLDVGPPINLEYCWFNICS